MEAHLAHNQEYAGSSPVPAISSKKRECKMLNEEQIYALGGEMSEDGLNFILDLIDEYVELKEVISQERGT